MTRERWFLFGGIVTIGLGIALAVAIGWAGAGWQEGWLPVGFAIVIGAFFVHVAREERRFRRGYLRAVEEGRPPPPGGPPW
ncbi:MAG TPA: hypothetical protein VLX64_03650 [Thermoplasmata archaeon]|nr:hypothetical protein [Thermoplasmata archaeon]